MYQGLEESATTFEVDPTKIIAHGNKKGIIMYTGLLKAKNPAEIEAILIPAATRGHNNTNTDFTSYAPVPPFTPKKIVEENSSTSQENAVSCVKALTAFEPTQSVIANLINAPVTAAHETQPTAAPAHTTGKAIKINEGQSGEQTDAEVSDTSKKS